MLNSKQVDQLFQQNAALFGHVDGVPEYRVVELFGEAAVEFTQRSGCGCGNYNGYGIGDYTAMYFTHKGFRVAATYVNVRQTQKLESV